MNNVKYLITKEDAIRADEEILKIAEICDEYREECDFGFLMSFLDMIKSNVTGEPAQFAELWYGKEIEHVED